VRFPACGSPAPSVSDAFFAQVLASVVDPSDAGLRQAALGALATQPLNADRKRLVLEHLPQLGPVELRRVLTVFKQDRDPALGEQLLAALAETPLRP
jgi:hypothetical protein